MCLSGLLGIKSEEALLYHPALGAVWEGFEFKFADAPKTTKSMHIAVADLALDHLYIIYPGQREIPFSGKITAISLESWIQKD